jgi:hypothetical protein
VSLIPDDIDFGYDEIKSDEIGSDDTGNDEQ